MAVSGSNLTSGSSSTDATSYTTASFTPTSNALVLAAVAVARTGAPGTPTLTGNSLTWVLVDDALYDVTGTFSTLFVFRAMGSSPSNGTLVIDFAGVTHLGCNWAVDQFTSVDTTGTNGSGAIVQAVPEVETDLGTTASVTLAAFASANNGTYGATAHQTNEDTAFGSGFTELADVTSATPVIALQTQWKATNDTVVDTSWATAGEKAGIIGIELKALTVVPSMTVVVIS